MNKVFASILFSVCLTGTAVSGVNAVFASSSQSPITGPITDTPQIPSFMDCSNPQGTLIADNTGVHGIVGDFNVHTGRDKVYKLTDKTYTQCFCPDTDQDQGVQTNWWNVSDLTQSQINYLTANGWIYVLNGADWGLPAGIYVAKNSTIACENGECVTTKPTPTITVTPTATPSSTPTVTPTETPTHSGTSATSSTATAPVHNSAVMTLAATGNAAQIALFAAFGSASIFSGLILRRFTK
jgi:hypothetical protein